MSQDEFNKYRLIFKSTPNLLNFNNQSLRSFPTMYMMSDIFGFYPYGELYLDDPAGVIIDNAFFVEGLKIEYKIGNDEEGYVGHDFSWSENQVNNTVMADYVSGNNVFILLSYYNTIDTVRSKAWKDKTLSTVITDIVNNDFGITDVNKINIFDTTGDDTWYQINSTIRDFLWFNREQAYTENYPNSPYISFINTNGEFYFTCLESLFNEQKPVANYKFSFSKSSSIDPTVIKDYDIVSLGVPKNKFNYKKKLYTIDKAGTYGSSDTDIKDFSAVDSKGKVIIRQQLQETYSDYRSMGIKETVLDEYRINAQRNFENLDSALSTRLPLTINFNPKCVTGKLIELTVGSTIANKQVLSELSGNWLIISDRHFMDQDGIPHTSIVVAKSKINVNNNHPFFNDFLS